MEQGRIDIHEQSSCSNMSSSEKEESHTQTARCNDSFFPGLYFQWLRREAVRRVVAAVLPASGERSHFWQHLDLLIWLFLRQAVCVPRDVSTIREALSLAPEWVPSTIIARGSGDLSGSDGTGPLIVNKPVVLLAEGVVTLHGHASAPYNDPVVLFDGESVAGATSLQLPELRGFHIKGSGACCVRVTAGGPVVRGCHLVASAGCGLIVTGVAQPLVHKNHVMNCKRGGVVLKRGARAIVKENSIEANDGGGIIVKDEACPDIVDNDLICNGGPAIVLRGSGKTRIRRNRFDGGNKGCGIMVRDVTEPWIEANQLRGHKMSAIALQNHGGGVIVANTLEGNDGVGVLISGTGAPIVENNDIRNNRQSAQVIEFRTSAGSTAKARITGTREDGQNGLTHELEYISGGSGVEWVNLDEAKRMLQNQAGRSEVPFEMIGRMGRGTTDDGEGGKLHNASLTKSVKRSAIAIKKKSVAIVRGNRLKDNQGYGIFISDTARPILEKNIVKGHSAPAVAFESRSAGELRGNHISMNSGVGIEVRDMAGPTIEDNDIDNNGEAAIALRHNCDCTVRGNRLTRNFSHGIIVCERAFGNLEANELSFHPKAAIVMRDKAAGFVRANIFDRNATVGIMLCHFARPLVEGSIYREECALELKNVSSCWRTHACAEAPAPKSQRCGQDEVIK